MDPKTSLLLCLRSPLTEFGANKESSFGQLVKSSIAFVILLSVVSARAQFTEIDLGAQVNANLQNSTQMARITNWAEPNST